MLLDSFLRYNIKVCRNIFRQWLRCPQDEAANENLFGVHV